MSVGSRPKAEPEIRLEGGRDVPFGCMLTSTGARAGRSQFDAPGVLSPPLLARSGEPLLAASNFDPMLRAPFTQPAPAQPTTQTLGQSLRPCAPQNAPAVPDRSSWSARSRSRRGRAP